MTGLIAIDESGDLGPRGSRYFVVAAIVTDRSRHLLKAYKTIPKGNTEMKFYSVAYKDKKRVLTEVAGTNVRVVYVCVDKEKQIETYGSGNELYRRALEEVIKSALLVSQYKDVNVFVDKSRFIKNGDLKEMVNGLSQELGKNIVKCDKVSSNKCVSIADFVAGAIWTKYETGNEEFFETIKVVIRCP